jgi:hypothetical protein
MGRRAKHEEHANHERWLVSYADMVTLLFALFVVLYAIGVTELDKLKKLKKSIQFAFHIAGEGKTKDEGVFDQQKGSGDVPLPAPLVNAQDGAMKEFLHEVLPREFEEVTGKSIEIRQTDDTVTFRTSVSAFFDAQRAQPIKREVYNWLIRAAQGCLTFSSDILIVIESPDVIIGEREGRPVTSLELCDRRLWTLRKAVLGLPEVRPHMVRFQLAAQQEVPAAPGGAGAAGGAEWEDRAQVVFAFSNARGR